MQVRSVFTGLILTSLITAGAILPDRFPVLAQTSSPETTDVTGLTPAQQLERLQNSRGQFGSGDQLRRYFFGDLEPIAIQPGGAGTVVNLYNAANDITIAYCSTYDVVVAIGEGRITEFPADEVQ